MIIGVEMTTCTGGTIVRVVRVVRMVKPKAINIETTVTEMIIVIVETWETVVVEMIDRAEINITGLLRAPAISRKKICIPDW
jgi:hypothetical protein